MNIKDQDLRELKVLKNLQVYFDNDNKEVVFERDKIFFTIYKNEIFPLQRALTRLYQSMRSWKKTK